MEPTGYYRSLTRNMILTMILVSCTPLLLISAIIGYQFETSYHEKVVAYLKELVQKHEQIIDGFLHEKLSNIGVMAFANDFEHLSNEDFLQHKLTSLQMAYGNVFVDLGVVDAKGAQLAYAGPFKLEKANYADAEWFQNAIKSQYYISDVFLGLRRQPHFIVAVKRESAGGEWLLRATIDFVAFNTLVENIRIGRTGTAFILNSKGEFQTQPQAETPINIGFFMQFVSGKGAESAPPTMGDELLGGSDVVMRQSGTDASRAVFETGDYLGREFVYVMVPLKSGQWMLGFQQDAYDAFSDLLKARYLAIFINVFGGLGIIAMAFVLSRKMVRFIERADREKEMMTEQVIEAGKLASVGELAAGIAHEINNPVAVMVEEAGWIGDLLAEEEFQQTPNLEEFKHSLKMIRTQGERCKEITHKLLSFARKTDPKVREVEINDLITEIVSISEQRAKYGNIHLTMNLAEGLPVVLASPSEMQQVLLNLINNAIDGVGSGGGTIDVTSRINNGYVVIDVADSGQGIPQANLARIFDPFFTTKPVGKGTGLGLSICYGIIKKMGGEISVNSAVGVGTTFHIYLPVPKK